MAVAVHLHLMYDFCLLKVDLPKKKKNLQKQRATHAVIFDKIMGKVDQIHPLAFGSFLSYDLLSRK